MYLYIHPLSSVRNAFDYANLGRAARQQATEEEVKRICIYICVYFFICISAQLCAQCRRLRKPGADRQAASN